MYQRKTFFVLVRSQVCTCDRVAMWRENTSVGLVSYFSDTIWVTIRSISHFVIPIGYGYLTIFLV